MTKETVLRVDSGFGKFMNSNVMLGLILLLGAALRFYDLGAESYWIDEISTIIEGQQNLQQLFTSGKLNQPPAYYLPFHFWLQIFGDTEVSTRSFSVLFGLASVFLTYVVGKELFDEKIGLLGALLMAVSEFQIYHSQTTRFYSFFEFTVLLSFLFFILSLRNKRTIYFAFYGIASVIMICSHAFGVFILVAQNLFLVLQGKRHSDILIIWLACQALVLLTVMPYLNPLVFGSGGIEGAIDSNIPGKASPTLLSLLRSAYHFVFSARRERSWEEIIGNYLLAGVFFVTGFIVYVIQLGRRELVDSAKGLAVDLKKIPGLANNVLLVSCWFLCPIVLPAILSVTLRPIYDDNYTIGASPALCLLLAMGIFAIRKVFPLIISLGVLAIMIVPGLGHYYFADIKEQWREVAEYVAENAAPDDVVVFAPNMGIGIQQKSFDWYYQGNLRECGLSSTLVQPVAISETLMQCVYGNDRFWVIIADYSNVGSDDRFRSFFLSRNQTWMRLIGSRQFVGLSIHLFELTNADFR
jgi:uncharacterized membrane protein